MKQGRKCFCFHGFYFISVYSRRLAVPLRPDLKMKKTTVNAGPIPYLDLPAQMRAIRKDADAAIARTPDNCTSCLGPDVAQFANEFARFLGADLGIGFNSSTSAPAVALLLL